jgi:hypothetical protein
MELQDGEVYGFYEKEQVCALPNLNAEMGELYECQSDGKWHCLTCKGEYWGTGCFLYNVKKVMRKGKNCCCLNGNDGSEEGKVAQCIPVADEDDCEYDWEEMTCAVDYLNRKISECENRPEPSEVCSEGYFCGTEQQVHFECSSSDCRKECEDEENSDQFDLECLKDCVEEEDTIKIEEDKVCVVEDGLDAGKEGLCVQCDLSSAIIARD